MKSMSHSGSVQEQVILNYLRRQQESLRICICAVGLPQCGKTTFIKTYVQYMGKKDGLNIKDTECIKFAFKDECHVGVEMWDTVGKRNQDYIYS